MCRQNVHRMDKFPEVSVYGIDEHIWYGFLTGSDLKSLLSMVYVI